jgi:hypothetical protein
MFHDESVETSACAIRFSYFGLYHLLVVILANKEGDSLKSKATRRLAKGALARRMLKLGSPLSATPG